MCVTDEELLELCDSLPQPYRDVIDWIQDRDTNWDVKAGNVEGGHEALDIIVCIALDMLKILCLASRGAKVHPLTNEHRRVVVECLIKKRNVADVEKELGPDTRQKLAEACGFLLDGQLNIVRRTLQLRDPHRTVFIRIFFEGIDPKDVAAEIRGLDRAAVEGIFREALDQIAKMT
jgi:hypothetical protein